MCGQFIYMSFFVFSWQTFKQDQLLGPQVLYIDSGPLGCDTRNGQVLLVATPGHKSRLHSLVREGLCVRRDLGPVCEA